MLLQTATTNSDSETFRNIMAALTFVLAIINLIYAITIFRYKEKKDDSLKAKDIRMSAFNTLIVAPHLQLFFDFFNSIESELSKLRNAEINDNEKVLINGFVIDQLTTLRIRFVDLFRSVSERLYRRSLNSLDLMVDQLTRNIFENNHDFTSTDVFQEKVLIPLLACRTAVLTQMIEFDGSEDTTQRNPLSILP